MSKLQLSRNLEIHYEEIGTGRPLLFIHGVWCSGRYFRKQLSELGKKYRVIAIDLRGHGESTHINDGHTMAVYAQDLCEFIEKKKLNDVVLSGWSMGCMVIWDYFKQFGNKNVSGTILIDQSPSDFKWPDWDCGVFDLQSLTNFMAEVQTDREKVFRNFISMLFSELPAEEDFEWMLQECMRIPATIASSVLFDQTMQDYRDSLYKVNVPTLVISGGIEGKLLPIESIKYVHENIRNSKFSIFENSNHCPFYEETERFNKEVELFVNSI